MYFIVSVGAPLFNIVAGVTLTDQSSQDSEDPNNLEHHMNRAGSHFRSTIVDVARASLASEGKLQEVRSVAKTGVPEPIPDSQRDINRQADAVLRDLFPRIPHTDRREIIQHAFKKVRAFSL
jgi:hypothetical protein